MRYLREDFQMECIHPGCDRPVDVLREEEGGKLILSRHLVSKDHDDKRDGFCPASLHPVQ